MFAEGGGYRGEEAEDGVVIYGFDLHFFGKSAFLAQYQGGMKFPLDNFIRG